MIKSSQSPCVKGSNTVQSSLAVYQSSYELADIIPADDDGSKHYSYISGGYYLAEDLDMTSRKNENTLKNHVYENTTLDTER